MQELWHLATTVIGALVIGTIFGGIRMYSQMMTNNAEIGQLKQDHQQNKAEIAAQDVRQRAMQETLARIDENIKRLLVEKARV